MKPCTVRLVMLALLLVCSALIGVSVVMGRQQGDDGHNNSATTTWDDVLAFLKQGVTDGVTPGAVAVVGNDKEIFFSEAVGHFTYGKFPAPVTNTNPATTLETLFDMASITKVLTTTTAVAQLYQNGDLDLDWKLADPRLFGPDYANNGKELITIRNCLLHNAGFPPDPVPNYWDKSFGCPETAKYHPGMSFNCQDKIYTAVLKQPLVNPVGAVYVYSDLSMINLMYVVGKIAREKKYVSSSDLIPGCDQGGLGGNLCYFEAYVRVHVLGALGMTSSGFRPPKELWGQCAPAWNDTSYRHEVIQGTVSDGNAYANGGISGHAGLFSKASDIQKELRMWLYPESNPSAKGFLNSTTVETFTQCYNSSQSSRALGWDTNNQANTIRTCSALSDKTFLHLGYTGTQVCLDPERKIFTMLLTNRVYPLTSNTKIMDYRRTYNKMVAEIVDAM